MVHELEGPVEVSTEVAKELATNQWSQIRNPKIESVGIGLLDC